MSWSLKGLYRDYFIIRLPYDTVLSDKFITISEQHIVSIDTQ